MNEALAKLLTGYVVQAILALIGVLGITLSEPQKQSIPGLVGAILSLIPIVLAVIANFKANQKKTETAVDRRTQAAIGTPTPATELVLQDKERQIADPKQPNPAPLIVEAHIPPDVVADAAEKIVERNPELSNPS